MTKLRDKLSGPCLENPAEVAPMSPDARRGNPAPWFPDRNYSAGQGTSV